MTEMLNAVMYPSRELQQAAEALMATGKCWLADWPANPHEGAARPRSWLVPKGKKRRTGYSWNVLVPICDTCAELRRAEAATRFSVAVDELREL